MYGWLIIFMLVLAIGVLLYIQISKLQLLHKLVASFDNSADGFSARKLSAFIGVSVSVIATFRFVDDKTVIEALMVWLVFALLCLGIITAEQLLKFYNKDKKDAPAAPVEEKKDETPPPADPPVDKL